MVWRRKDGDGFECGTGTVLPGGRAVRALPPECAQAEAYWQALRDGSALPARSSIAPRALAPFLDRVMILERIAPGVARLRMAGSRLHDLMGMDLRGMPLTALIEPASRGAVADAVERVFADPAIADLTLDGERGFGRPTLSGRLLLLPLTGPSGAADRALGVLVLDGETGRAPRRLALAGAVHRPVAGDRVPWPGPQDTAQGRAAQGMAAQGMAEGPASWRPAPPVAGAHPRAPWLRVVKNDG